MLAFANKLDKTDDINEYLQSFLNKEGAFQTIAASGGGFNW